MAIITEINEKNTEIQRQIYAQINEYDIRWWIHLFFLLFSRLSVNIVFFWKVYGWTIKQNAHFVCKDRQFHMVVNFHLMAAQIEWHTDCVCVCMRNVKSRLATANWFVYMYCYAHPLVWPLVRSSNRLTDRLSFCLYHFT